MMRYLSVHHTFSPKDEDIDIMESFTNEVNRAIKELENTIGVENVHAFAFHSFVTVDNYVIKAADLMFNTNEEYVELEDEEELDEEEQEDDDEDEGIMPELGTGRKKITEEVFNWIKDRYEDDDWSVREIVEAYEGELSSDTVRKVINTDEFENYHKKAVLSN